MTTTKHYSETLIYEDFGDLETVAQFLTELLEKAIKNPSAPVIYHKDLAITNLTMERLTSQFVPQEVRDNYTYIIQDLMDERYTLAEEENEVGVFKRVARAIAQNELEEKIFYAMMRLRLFMPATPTLMNAGRERGMLSSCFVIIPEDNMDSITDYFKEMVLTQKYGGGVGTDWSAIRPEGSPVNGTGGIASGFKAFFEAANALNDTVKQGSARSGANASTMKITHPEILKFIDLKKNDPQNYGFFNISVTVTDDQFRKVLNNEEIDLSFNGSTYETVSGREIMNRVASNAWKTGDPSWYFLDKTNDGMWNDYVKGRLDPWGNPYGIRHSHNPCISGSTLISTEYGYQPIEDLIGRIPQLYTDGLVDYPEDILLTETHGEVFKVELSNGSIIEATLDHKFPTVNGKMTLKDIINSDDKIELVLDLSKKPFGRGGTLEEGEIAGFFAGDGSEYRNRIYLYDEALEHFGDNFYGYHISFHESNEKPRGVVNIGKRFPYELGHSRFVEQYFSMSEDFLRGYLRGLASADGSVYDANGSVTVAFHSNNKDFLRDIQLILNQFGIYSKIYGEKKEETKTIRGQEFTFKETFRLLLQGSTAKQFIEDIGFSVDYKQEKAKKLLEGYSPYNIDRSKVTVEEVEFKGIEAVYDVKNMKPNHEFVANGLRTSNCGEQNLPHHGVCNLGSINLFALTDANTGYMDWKLFHIVTRMATRFLDNVIDENWFPVEEIWKQSKHLRNIGLGFMGLADHFYLNEIDYNSEMATELAGFIADKMTFIAKEESRRLAKEKGVAPVFDKYNCSCFEDVDRPEQWLTENRMRNCPHEHPQLRNSDLTCIAPTGSIRLLSCASGGLEPYFMTAYEKLVYPKGTRTVEKYITIKAQALSLFPNRKEPLTAMDISPRDHIDILAVVGKNVTNAVSKTVNCPNETTVEEIKDLYRYAFEKGVKSLSIYRDGCRSDEAQRAINDDSKDEIDFEDNTILDEKDVGEAFRFEEWNKSTNTSDGKIVEGDRSVDPVVGIVDNNDVISNSLSCPACGSQELTFQEGCQSCMACNWGACTS